MRASLAHHGHERLVVSSVIGGIGPPFRHVLPVGFPLVHAALVPRRVGMPGSRLLRNRCLEESGRCLDAGVAGLLLHETKVLFLCFLQKVNYSGGAGCLVKRSFLAAPQ